MIDKTLITINECMNDGAVIHLYYNDKSDTWMAYGLSAYMLCHIGEKSYLSILCGFSDEIQMPYAEADKRMTNKLFCNYSDECGKDMSHLKFWLSEPINLDSYVRWAKLVKQF